MDFRPYFADLPPPMAATLVCVVGVTALYLLQKHFGFCVQCRHSAWRGWVTSAALAVPFMVIVTLLDLTLKFPDDINVELPTALIFYPAMGVVAQLSLHILPFALLLWVFTRLFGTPSSGFLVWLCIALAALPEAVFQMSGPATPGAAAAMLSGFVAAQLFVFGIVELYLFRRYDFVCMYVFRLTYYGYWHIIWEFLRV